MTREFIKITGNADSLAKLKEIETATKGGIKFDIVDEKIQEIHIQITPKETITISRGEYYGSDMHIIVPKPTLQYVIWIQDFYADNSEYWTQHTFDTELAMNEFIDTKLTTDQRLSMKKEVIEV